MENNQQVVNSSQQPLPLAIIATLAAIVFASVMACALYIRYRMARRTRRALASKTTKTAITDSAGNSVVEVDVNVGMTDSANVSQLTTLVTSHELSIPAYLSVIYAIDYTIGSQLARGGQGAVCLCNIVRGSALEQRARGLHCVAKVSDSAVQYLSQGMRDAFFQEVTLHHRFRDVPGFAQLVAYCVAPQATLIMKYYPFGSLNGYIRARSDKVKQFPYSKHQLVVLMKGCAAAFGTMHEAGIVHQDVKPDNVLVELSPLNPKLLSPVITDFGIAHVLADKDELLVKAFSKSTLKGLSMAYGSPEQLLMYRYKIQVDKPEMLKCGDVYSLAVVIYQSMSRQDVWVPERTWVNE